MDTAQCIWTTALALNRDVTIDSYQNSNTKQELFLIRERKVERIVSENISINRFVISEPILKCLNMMWDNWSNGSGLYAINTDGIFMTKPTNHYPNKKDVKFNPSHIGKIFTTDSPATYFEKHYRENFNTDNFTDYVCNGAIYSGCGKTWRLCNMASKAVNPIILSFTITTLSKMSKNNLRNIIRFQV